MNQVAMEPFDECCRGQSHLDEVPSIAQTGGRQDLDLVSLCRGRDLGPPATGWGRAGCPGLLRPSGARPSFPDGELLGRHAEGEKPHHRRTWTGRRIVLEGEHKNQGNPVSINVCVYEYVHAFVCVRVREYIV